MKTILLLSLGLLSFRAFAGEKVSLPTALFGFFCVQQECLLTKPVVRAAEIELRPAAHGRLVGSLERTDARGSLQIGGRILLVHHDGLYLFFITSWVQEIGKPETRLESHVSVTTEDLAHLPRVNLPSPDLVRDDEQGRAQFMIGSRMTNSLPPRK